ncbi:MAG: epoxyqueuosine reductase QueH [Coriobacteriaceae bacterium]|jgi:predicted adenine nucleotide alpha hydrolase (AANH) superfamily ATPase|nr:epoxyqueuosine reductase QueH [Coriobacteriaceae bacterium]
MKLLLHACCGPCSLEPVRVLHEAGHQVCLAYMNSNIYPEAEYERRRDTLHDWAESLNIPFLEGNYDPSAWEDAVAGWNDVGRLAGWNEARGVAGWNEAGGTAIPNRNERRGNSLGCNPERGLVHATSDKLDEGRENGLEEEPVSSPCNGLGGNSDDKPGSLREGRCRLCYRLRFAEAAAYASTHGFEGICTTLSVSPYQFGKVIQEELEAAAQRRGIKAHFVDFSPLYPEATRRSRELGMYRQNYCGCRFSLDEAAAERAERRQARKAVKGAPERQQPKPGSPV